MDEYVCTLSEEAKEHAAKHLNEDEELRHEEIRKIQMWLQSQPHLNARLDAVSVVRFLRGCKFNTEKTQNKLKCFYTMRSKIPEWFHQRDPSLPQLQELIKLGVFLPLRLRDNEGHLIVLIRAAVHNPKCHLQSDFFKVCKMILEIAMEEDESLSVFGVVAIVDLTGISLSHSLQLTPSVISKAVHTWQDCYPVRTRSMNFVNAPSYVNIVLNVFRRFMTEKMRSRVHVYGNNQSLLHAVVPYNILPKEYGGSDGSVQDIIDFWESRLSEKRGWLMEDEMHKADLNYMPK